MSLSASGSWKESAVANAKADAPVRYTSRYEVSPERQLLEQRQLALAMRTAAYSTALAGLAAAAAVTTIAWRHDLHTWDDCTAALRAWGQSWRPRIQATMLPWRDYAQSWVRARRGEQLRE
jgi:hypothetical protein